MAERSIDEQFAALPDAIKSRLFRILDVVLGASHDEKEQASHMLTQSYADELPEPVPALLNAVAALVVHADAQAGGAMVSRPVLAGQSVVTDGSSIPSGQNWSR